MQNEATTYPKLLTYEAAAQALGVSKRTLQRHIRDRWLKVATITSRTKRISPMELAAFVQRMSEGTLPEPTVYDSEQIELPLGFKGERKSKR